MVATGPPLTSITMLNDATATHGGLAKLATMVATGPPLTSITMLNDDRYTWWPLDHHLPL